MGQYSVDDLLDLLDKRKPASDSFGPPAELDVNRPQVQPTVHIESTPIAEPSMQPIKRVNDYPKTELGEFNRQNQNNIIVDNIDTNSYFRDLKDKTRENDDASRETYSKFIRNMSERANKDAPEVTKPNLNSQDILKRYEAEQKSLDGVPTDVGVATQLISAIGPAVLGIGMGGYAGADAAVATQKYANDRLSEERKRIAREREVAILNSGRKLSGIAALAKAEADAGANEFKNKVEGEKLQDNRMKDLGGFIKFARENDIKADEKALDLYLNSQKLVSDSAEKGLTSVVGTEQKGIDATNQATLEAYKSGQTAKQKGEDHKWESGEKEKDRAGALARAKIMGATAAKRADRPSEGETKYAVALSQLHQGENSYQAMLKDYKTPPSMTDPFFEKYKSLFESADANTPMGILLKQVPEGKTKRQITAELTWLAAKLRKESGAAINAGEYIGEGNINFPRKGDNPETIAEKNATRENLLNSYKLAAGRAPISTPVAPKYAPANQDTREQKLKRLKELEGR